MIIGIVGKPNVGKSAFFRSLTLAKAESGNFPFTTINPNSAIGYVKTEDPAVFFQKRSNPRDGFVKGNYRFVPVEIIDVAGLVPGAHEGKGLGNKFLDDLRQADVLIHVIDLSGSTNDKGEPVELNSYDPANDIRFLEEELDQWYNNIIEKHWANIEKKFRMQDMKLEEALSSVLSGLKISENQIAGAISDLDLNKENIGSKIPDLSRRLRQLSKPMLIAANKCDAIPDLWEKKINDLKMNFPEYEIVPIVAEFEWNLKMGVENEMLDYIPGEDSFRFLKQESLSSDQIKGLNRIAELVKQMKSTGVQNCLDYAVFKLLKMKPIFPGGAKLEDKDGNVLPDCFLMEEKATALDFAYRLHSDFGDNFIKAVDIKTKRMVGKDHILVFGDVVEVISGK